MNKVGSMQLTKINHENSNIQYNILSSDIILNNSKTNKYFRNIDRL
jgi:hypothetical protein